MPKNSFSIPKSSDCLTYFVCWVWFVRLLLSSPSAAAQTLAFNQAKTVAIAGLNEGYAFGSAIAADAQGNTYITGNFAGTQHFGNITLIARPATPAIGVRMYVAKLDPNGNVLWAVQGGGDSDNYSESIVLDGQGNVYVAGSYLGRSASYGNTTLQNNGSNNGSFFIAKLTAGTGQWQWAVGSTDGGVAAISGLAVDRRGNVMATGLIGYSQQGPTSLGAFPLPKAGSTDIVVAKLSPTGTWRWAVAVGSVGSEEAADIALDQDNNAYIIGQFMGPRLDFGQHQLVHSQAGVNGSDDVFVAKIDSGGSWQWATGAGGIGIDRGYGIAVDGYHHVFAAGSFSRTANFGATRLTSSGDNDVFVACLTQAGNWRWAVAGGGPDSDAGVAVAADGTGGLCVGGSFYLRGNAVARFGNTTLGSAGVTDAFVARLDSLGNYQGVVAGGGLLEDGCSGIAAVGNRIYLTGTISSSINISPTARFGGYSLAANPTSYGRMYTAWVSQLIVLPEGSQPPGDGDVLNSWNTHSDLPNIITPNNDGYNDYFAPKNFPAGPWQLTIYNRWGARIYRTDDYQADWGSAAADGIYYYLLQHQSTDKTYKGWLEVIH